MHEKKDRTRGHRWILSGWPDVRRSVAVTVSLFLGGAAVALYFGCSSNIPDSDKTSAPPPSPEPTDNVAVVFDPGVDLLQDGGVSSFSSVGAVVGDTEVVFFAFASRADPRVPGATPEDDNGASDVYVAALIPSDPTSRERKVNFQQDLLPVFQHERCVNCHDFRAVGHPDGPTSRGHTGGLPSRSTCADGDCHKQSITGVPDREWWSPPPSFSLRGKRLGDIRELFELFAVPGNGVGERAEDVVVHMKTSSRIVWAFSRGTFPQLGDSRQPAAPLRDLIGMTLQEWRDLVDAWDEDGRRFFPPDAVKATILVSQFVPTGRGQDPAVGDGPSGDPRVAFVPGVKFDPDDPGSEPFGFLHVAFVTEAANLRNGGSGDIIRATLEVRLEPTGDEDSPLTVRLQEPRHLLVSRSAVGEEPVGANGDSTLGSISPDGSLIAYESLASDLVPGFSDRNGEQTPDIYLARIDETPEQISTETLLVSAAAGSGDVGGDGGSFNPALAATAEAVAFESDAGDLVAGDTNGVRDIFYAFAEPGGGISGLRRASVKSDGEEGSGGSCRSASLTVLDASAQEVLVAFESEKTDLTSSRRSRFVGTNVFLHDSRAPGGTTLVSIDSETGAFGNGGSRRPRISPSGDFVVFESDASNLDSLRRGDRNGKTDVMMAELKTFLKSGDTTDLRLQRLSVSSTGDDGDDASTEPLLAAFRSAGCEEELFVSFVTDSDNLRLGAGANTSNMFLLLRDDPRAVLPASVEPTVALAASLEEVNIGDRIVFDSAGSSDEDEEAGIRFLWDFGDGSQATGPVASHAYGRPGDYTVTLKARDSSGVCASQTTRVFVNEAPICSAQLAVERFFDIGEDVAFDGSGSMDPDAETRGDVIVSHEWDFGDGSPGVEGASPTHAFGTAGEKTVTLTVTDSFGATSSCSVALVVNTPPVVTVTAVPSRPIDTAVEFDGAGSSDPDPGSRCDPDGIVSYSWEFGDADASTALGPRQSFVYTQPGTYTVTLTVRDRRNSETTESLEVLIVEPTVANQPPAVQCSASTEEALVGEVIDFAATGAADPDGADSSLEFTWYFDDFGIPAAGEPPPPETTARGETASFAYDFPGSYRVRLRVTDAGGASTDCFLDVKVAPTFTYVFENVIGVDPADDGPTRYGCATAPSCHVAGGGATSPDFSLKGTAYAELVGQDATRASCAFVRVSPGEPDQSLLVRVLEGFVFNCSAPMPVGVTAGCPNPGLAGPFAQAESERDLQAIRDWILRGAPDD